VQISKLLVVNPKERLTALEALNHPFFKREEVCVCVCVLFVIFGPGRRIPKTTLVVHVLVVVVISSLKIPKAFLCSGTKLCLHIRVHVPYRSDLLSQIFS